MSITTIFSVFCDGADCNQWVAESLSLKAARSHARSAGWKRAKRDGRMVDLCPVCGDTACRRDPRDFARWCVVHQSAFSDDHGRCDLIRDSQS